MVSPSTQAASATFHPVEPDVLEVDREPDLQAEVHQLLDLRGRALIEHGDGAEQPFQ